ncbi:phosphatase PAP2 family protein [Streptomyces hainanensis]|uniref:Inositol phosphorylceramide synthase n=1 Tax=Streptomyces hainanensis TaxID=402648 RepID=A0A4R4TIC3_9ACTN|nr:inositol phosphorylceramide synthase [Streptomyces hainanensis]
MGAGGVTVKEEEQVEAAEPVTNRSESASAARPRHLARLRAPHRPKLWFELLLIAVSYGVYSLIRNAAPESIDAAQRHARWIWDIQGHLSLDFELAVNHAVAGITWLIVPMNYYYATLHFVVTIGVLIWLFRYHPGRYGATRLVLFATTGVALLGYYFFPLAPPRLMAGMDFIDTAAVHRTWGSLSNQGTAMADVSNQYAAMPSMHIGWSLWCGITVAVLARPLWLRILGALYPALTLLVIVATANHFWLDAVGGAICLAFGYLVARLWFGRWCYRLPRQVPEPELAPSAARPS